MDTVRGNPNYHIIIHRSDPELTITAPMPESFMFDSSAQYEAPFAQGWVPTDTIRNFAGAMGFRTTSQALTMQIWQGNQDTDLGLELEFQAEADPVKEVLKPIADLLTLTTPIAESLSGLMKAPGPHLDIKTFLGLTDQQSKSAPTGDLLNRSYEKFRNSTDPQNLRTASLSDGSQTVNTGQNTPQTAQAGSASVSATSLVESAIRGRISIKIGNYMFFRRVVILDVQQTFTSQLDPQGVPWYAKVAVRFRPAFTIVQSDLNEVFMNRVEINPGKIDG